MPSREAPIPAPLFENKGGDRLAEAVGVVCLLATVSKKPHIPEVSAL
jgi:hypothetical protein